MDSFFIENPLFLACFRLEDLFLAPGSHLQNRPVGLWGSCISGAFRIHILDPQTTVYFVNRLLDFLRFQKHSGAAPKLQRVPVMTVIPCRQKSWSCFQIQTRNEHSGEMGGSIRVAKINRIRVSKFWRQKRHIYAGRSRYQIGPK